VGSVSSSSGGLAGIDVRVLDDPDNAVRVGTAIGQPLDLPFTVAVFC
jgi:hypothetical protein